MSDSIKPNKLRGRKKGITRQMVTEARAKAVDLRRAGASYTVIGAQLGVTPQMAHVYVKTAMAEVRKKTAEIAEDVLQMELERLDRCLLGCFSDAAKGNLQAIDRVLKIIESRARLLGINAPVKVAATTADGEDAPRGVIVVPAPAASVEEWLDQATQWAQQSG